MDDECGGAGNPLDSDQLGEVGETTFKVLCAKAGLHCNQSARDRSGWDFVVEWPLDHEQPSDLDKRRNPLSCMFQVKAMWDHNDRIKFRLSSLELLAKAPSPSFVCVLKIGKDLEPTAAFLIHMRGDVLGKVLKRLRKEQAAQHYAVNRASMYLFASADGSAFTPSGDALRKAVEDAVGNDAAYGKAKEEEIRTLGYDPFPREMKLSLRLKDSNELVDVMLGRTTAQVEDVRTSETRFGIKIETNDFARRGELRFQPFPMDTCEIVVRRDKFAEAATFKGCVYRPPKQAGVEFAIRIVTDLFEMMFRESQFQFSSTKIEPDAPVLSPSNWRKFFLLAEAVAQPGALLEIRPGSPRLGRIKQTLRGQAAGSDPEQVAAGLEAAGLLVAMLSHAGAAEEPTLSWAQLALQADHIASGHAILSGVDDLTPLSFGVPDGAADHLGAEASGVHVNYVRFATGLLVWSADVVMGRAEDGEAKFTAKRLEMREMLLLKPDAYVSYLAGLRESGASFVMSREDEVANEAEPWDGANAAG